MLLVLAVVPLAASELATIKATTLTCPVSIICPRRGLSCCPPRRSSIASTVPKLIIVGKKAVVVDMVVTTSDNAKIVAR